MKWPALALALVLAAQAGHTQGIRIRSTVTGNTCLGSARGYSRDASTTALWRFDTSTGASVTDDVGAYPLTLVGSPAVVAGVFGNARTFTASGTYGTFTADNALKTIMAGEWTVEAIVRHPYSWVGTSTRYFFSVAGTDAGETNAENSLGSVGYNSDGAGTAMWESGAGVNSMDQISSRPIVGAGTFHYVAWRKRLSAGNYLVDFIVNGVLVTSTTAVATSAGGANAVGRVAIYGSSNSTSGAWAGDINQIRVSSVARTLTELAEPFNAACYVR